MSLTLGYLLATVGAQAGSAYFNCRRGSKQAKALALKQQEFEEKVLRDGMANAQQEFAEVCALQRELELQMQSDRTKMIRDNHQASLLLEAYRQSLEDWPLFVPPFIIKNESLPLIEGLSKDTTNTIAVNCILTPSMDSSFNLKIFPKMEEYLARFCSKYWASNSAKAIRFYQNAWRNNITDIGSKMHDLKAHLNEVPTIVLSPIIDDDKLTFSFSWWGFSNNPDDEHLMEADNIYDPELSVSVSKNMTYTEDSINSLLEEAVPKLAAFISYFADLYYWNYYHMTPSLPVIMRGNPAFANLTSMYIKQYENILLNYVSERKNGYIESIPIVRTVQNLKVLNKNNTIADILLDKLLTYKDRLSSIDISLISKLANQSQKHSTDIVDTVSQLKKDIRNYIFPCFNGGDLFFRAKEYRNTIPTKRIMLYAKAVERNVIAVFALDRVGDIVYSNANSGCCFMVLNKPLPSNTGYYFSLDFKKHKLKPVKSQKKMSILDSINFQVHEGEKEHVINFMSQAIKLGHEILPDLNLHNIIEKENDLEFYDFIQWIRDNHTDSEQFSFIVCYNNDESKYYYVGGFKGSEEKDPSSYFLASSKFINGELYKRLNHNCAYSINIK